MIKKHITYFGRSAVMACDGQCDKAWGINKRPKLYYMEPGIPPRELKDKERPVDDGDYLYLADGVLGKAPANPDTYEGGEGKPYQGRLNQANAHLMNKWCARECERSVIVGNDKKIIVPDLKSPKPNMQERNYK